MDSEGQTIWIVDAHRGDGKRFVVHADEILTAFLELEAAIGADRLIRQLVGNNSATSHEATDTESATARNKQLFWRIVAVCLDETD